MTGEHAQQPLHYAHAPILTSTTNVSHDSTFFPFKQLTLRALLWYLTAFLVSDTALST